MGHLFKNKYALGVGTTLVSIYGPTGDTAYSIISGMTIANKKLNEVLVSVCIVDSTNLVTAYLCSDSKLSVGSSMLLAGDLQKLVLKLGDTIQVKSNEADSLDVTMAVIEYLGPPIPLPPGVWFGDYAFVTGGDVNNTTIDTYTFATETWAHNVHTGINPDHKSGAGASNGTMCLFMANETVSTSVTGLAFATDALTNGYQTLHASNFYVEAASDGYKWIIFGGYNAAYSDEIVTASFAASETSHKFGDLDSIRSYCGAFGDSVYAVCVGGYTGAFNDAINYVSYATESNSSFWGNCTIDTYGATCVSNLTKGLITGNWSGVYTTVDELSFASTGNASNYGDLDTAEKAPGSIGDGTTAYFHNADSFSRGHLMLFEGGATSTQLNNLSNKRDGGSPASESGGV